MSEKSRAGEFGCNYLFQADIGSGLKVEHSLNVFNKPKQVDEIDFSSENENYTNRPKARVEVTGFIGDKITRAQILRGNQIQIGDLVKSIRRSDEIGHNQN